MTTINIVSVSAAVILTAATQSSWAGQGQAPARDGPVSASALGGASVGSGHAGATAGITLGVDLNDRVSLEGRGVYLDRGPGQSAVDLNASLVVDLLTKRRVVPYVSIGGGLYRAMFDLGNQRLFGMMGGFTWNNGTVSGATFAGSHMPMFYARRFGALTVPTDGRWHMQGFTDPAVSIGGGVRLDVTSRLYVRPDVRAVTIIGGGDTYTVGSVTFSVGYRF